MGHEGILNGMQNSLKSISLTTNSHSLISVPNAAFFVNVTSCSDFAAMPAVSPCYKNDANDYQRCQPLRGNVSDQPELSYG